MDTFWGSGFALLVTAGLFAIIGLCVGCIASTADATATAPAWPAGNPKSTQNTNQDQSERIRELERRLATARAESAKWRSRAGAAVASPAPVVTSTVRQDERFKQLRALLASELHPDRAKEDGLERAIRTQLFQTLWPRVEEIARQA